MGASAWGKVHGGKYIATAAQLLWEDMGSLVCVVLVSCAWSRAGVVSVSEHISVLEGERKRAHASDMITTHKNN